MLRTLYKVVLVNPPDLSKKDKSYFSSEHMGVGYLLSILSQDERIKASFIDADYDSLSVEETEERIFRKNPDLVAFSSLQYSYSPTKRICSTIKQKRKDIKICLGGLFISTLQDCEKHFPCVDYFIKGEGEFVFSELINFLIDSKDIQKLTNADTVVKFNGCLYLIKSSIIYDLDTVPFPHRSAENFDV